MERPDPIFILGSHKSGTSLLRNLFDGHPDLFVVPVEGHFFQLTGYPVAYRMRRERGAEYNLDEKVERMTAWVRHCDTRANRYSDSVMTGRWDTDAFRRTLSDSVLDSERGLFDAYINALYAGLSGAGIPDGIRFVEKSVEHAEFAGELLRLYPGCRFVHILRNPYAQLVSIRRYISHGRYPFLVSAVDAVVHSFHYALKNTALFPRYSVVRYEDLVSAPAAVMENLAGVLGLRFDEILCRPTVRGVDWQGNSVSDRRFRGVSAAPAERWKQDINDLEIHLVNRALGSMPERFGYERIQPAGGRWKPVRHELGCPPGGIKTYLKNRLLWFCV